MKKNNIDACSWTTAEFKKNEMRCPFIKNDRCSYLSSAPYSMQAPGNILSCLVQNKKNGYMSEEIVKKIKKDFEELNKKLGGVDIFYGTRKMTKI